MAPWQRQGRFSRASGRRTCAGFARSREEQDEIMDTLTILDRTGDTKLTWDPSDPDQCAAARAQVEVLKQNGYGFFLVDGRQADAVGLGDGQLVVKKITAAEVVEDVGPDTSGPVSEPSRCRCGKPKGHRGRCPGSGRAVVAVRPLVGG